MAAKEKTTWTVTCHFDTLEQTKACYLQNPTSEPPQKVATFVCPHCGKPWPIHLDNGEPMSEDTYRRNVESQRFDTDSYCCDATRDDCERANDAHTE